MSEKMTAEEKKELLVELDRAMAISRDPTSSKLDLGQLQLWLVGSAFVGVDDPEVLERRGEVIDSILDLGDIADFWYLSEADPGRVFSHPRMEDKVWAGEVDFSVSRTGMDAAIAYPDFPEYLENQLYVELSQRFASEGMLWQWSDAIVKGLAGHRHLSWELVKAWVSRLSGFLHVADFFVRDDVKGRENELMQVLAAAPSYAGDRHEMSRAVFQRVLELPGMGDILSDETLALCLGVLRQRSGYYDDGTLLQHIFGRSNVADPTTGEWLPNMRLAGRKTLEAAMLFDTERAREFLADWKGLPAKEQLWLGRHLELSLMSVLLNNKGLKTGTARAVLKRIVDGDLSQKGMKKGRERVVYNRVQTSFIARLLAKSPLLSWEEVKVLWDLYPFADPIGPGVWAALLNREDVPEPFIRGFVERENRTSEEWGYYNGIAYQLPEPWKTRAETRGTKNLA
jgi:hypothetical protein